MFVIIQNKSGKEIYNMDHVIRVFEEDVSATDPRSLWPYRITFTIYGQNHIVIKTDDKFQHSTIMAVLCQAIEEGKTVTIENPCGYGHAALVDRLTAMWTGNNRIEVIKECRTITGWGLKQAKEFCDEHIPREPHESALQQMQQQYEQEQYEQQLNIKRPF